jgi:putative acetyltransferase
MIRPLKESDIPTIRNIYEKANNSNCLSVEKDHFRSDAKKYVSETIHKCENLVCEIDGSVIGIISVSTDYIEGLFVHSDHFGKGIGKELLTHFLNKKKYLRLQVYEQNSRAINFYSRNGFKISGGGICQITGLPYFEMVYEKVS